MNILGILSHGILWYKGLILKCSIAGPKGVLHISHLYSYKTLFGRVRRQIGKVRLTSAARV